MSKQVANHPLLAAEDLSYLLIDMGSTVFSHSCNRYWSKNTSS